MLRHLQNSLFAAISNIQSLNHHLKTSSRFWMSKHGIRRYWQEQNAKKCPDCGEIIKKIYKTHPLPVPASLGKGVWLVKDCLCIKKQRKEERLQYRQLMSRTFQDPLPPALRRCNFKNFKVGEYNKLAYSYCEKFTEKFAKIKDGKGLLLYGQSGAGKSHLACAVANKLKTKYSVSFAYVPTFLEAARTKNMDLEQLLKVDLLVLDDLGSERGTDWTLEKLLIIVDGRINNFKSTIFTTNYPLEDLEKRIGMRLASRVIGNNLQLLVQGIDWRLQQANFRTS